MIIGGKRRCGKTTALIQKANKEHLYIICANARRAQFISEMARKLELDIPYPIAVFELPLKGGFIENVLVDDLEDVLYQLIGRNVLAASTSFELWEMDKIDH